VQKHSFCLVDSACLVRYERLVQTNSISPGALKTEEEHRRDLCTVGRWISDRGYVVATDGNVSLRLDSRRILTSPTGINKGTMTEDDVVIVDLDGHLLSGRRNPSSELAMHLLIYRLRPDINAVCHAHPPTATGYAAAGIPLNKALLCELVIALGSVPVARYGTPGTSELTSAIEPLVRGHDAILMANHGVVTYGQDLLSAFYRMETTEHFARVALVTELLGKQMLLSGGDVEKLLEARARYGVQTAGTLGPDGPVTCDAAETECVTLTRRELETLIDEAVQKDRARR
jgi:L-fuculose-phosphate aldolase